LLHQTSATVCWFLSGSQSLLITFSWRHVVGMMLFSVASWYHHRAHVTFAELRTSRKGNDCCILIAPITTVLRHFVCLSMCPFCVSVRPSKWSDLLQK